MTTDDTDDTDLEPEPELESADTAPDDWVATARLIVLIAVAVGAMLLVALLGGYAAGYASGYATGYECGQYDLADDMLSAVEDGSPGWLAELLTGDARDDLGERPDACHDRSDGDPDPSSEVSVGG